MAKDKVDIFVLCERRLFIVNAASTWQYTLIGKPFIDVGPRLDSVRIYGYGHDFGSAFQYKITAEWSYDGTDWTVFSADVTGTNSSVGNWISAVYSTTSDFGPLIRFSVGSWAYNPGTGGTLSFSVALIYKS